MTFNDSDVRKVVIKAPEPKPDPGPTIAVPRNYLGVNSIIYVPIACIICATHYQKYLTLHYVDDQGKYHEILHEMTLREFIDTYPEFVQVHRNAALKPSAVVELLFVAWDHTSRRLPHSVLKNVINAQSNGRVTHVARMDCESRPVFVHISRREWIRFKESLSLIDRWN